MTLLDRYLGARVLATLVRTIAGFVALFVLVDLLTHRRAEIFEYDVPWNVVVANYVWSVPIMLYEYQVAAIAMLVTTLLVFGAAAQRNEITAMLAAGISLRRIVVAPALIAAALSLAMFTLEESLGVVAADRLEAIENRYFTRSAESGRPGRSWAQLDGGWRFHVMKFNRIALTGEGVLMLRDGEEAGEQIQADRVFWDPDRKAWMLEDGLWSEFERGKESTARHRRITQVASPIVESPEDLFAFETSTLSKRASVLARDIERAEERGMPTARLRVDWHGKFAKPILCFVMVWLAVPFAMRLRRGGLAIGFGVSIAIGLVYLMVFVLTQGLGYLDRIPPAPAAWSANVLFMAIGFVLFARTPT